MIESLQRWRGARRAAAALCAGALATAAMPPFHIFPVLWLSIPALLVLLDGSVSRRDSFVVGWCFGFGHFAFGFFWIANAFYVDADAFGAFAVPAVGALCAGFAVYIGAVALMMRYMTAPDDDAMPDDRTRAIALRGIWFAIAWSGIEWVRGWFLSGFPWNPMATTWTAWPAMVQITALIGTLGLSFLTVLAAALATVLVYRPRFPLAWAVAAAPIGGLILVGVGGAVRLEFAASQHVPNVVIRLVQPNISQADKWRPGLRDQHLMDHIRLSIPEPGVKITHVVWGEAAVAFALDQDEARRQLVAGAIPEGGTLITGVTRADRSARGVEAIYNSMIAIDKKAAVIAVYDKIHLVPFGEYLPLRWMIPFPKLTAGTMDFSSGTERRTITVPGLPGFGPLICYEAVFSGAVVGQGERPQWLLNLTNDSWFGDSTGPRQHLAQARLRAVEEGLPLVRVANTGISAVFDAYGRLEGKLELGARGVLDIALPQTPVAMTLFGRLGNAPVLLILAVSTWGLFLIPGRRAKPANRTEDQKGI